MKIHAVEQDTDDNGEMSDIGSCIDKMLPIINNTLIVIEYAWSFGYQSIIDQPVRVKSNFVKSLFRSSLSGPIKTVYDNPSFSLCYSQVFSICDCTFAVDFSC